MRKIWLLYFIFCLSFTSYGYDDDKKIPSKLKEILAESQSRYTNKKYKEAAEILEKYYMETDDKKYYILILNMANSFAMSGDFKKAEKYYKQGLEYFPDSKEFHNNLGKIYYDREEYKKAASEFKLAFSEMLNGKKEIELLGACYLYGGSYYSALQIFKHGEFLYPETLNIRKGIIESLIMLEKYGDAEIVCRDTLKIFPGEMELRKLLAHICMELEKYDEAIKILEMCRFLGGSDKDLYFSLGDLYNSRGMFKEALKYYVKAVGKNKKKYEDLYRIAYAYYSSNDNANAEKFIREAVKKKKTGEAYLLLGKIYYDNERYSKAVEYFDVSSELSLGSGESFLLKGYSYLKMNQYEKAETEFRHAKMFNDYKIRSLTGLGEVYYYKGDIAKALDYYGQAYRYSPGDKSISETLKFLEEEVNRTQRFRSRD